METLVTSGNVDWRRRSRVTCVPKWNSFLRFTSVKSLVSSSKKSETLTSTFSELFKRATVSVIINNKVVTALLYTGSTGSFIAYDYAKKHRLQMDSATGNVYMASSSLNYTVKGPCTVNHTLKQGFHV